MNTRIFTLLFFLGLASGNAQSSIKQLKGHVLDTLTKEKLPYVSILVQTPDSIFIDGNMTDNKGAFNFQLPKGSYLLTFSFMGYEKKSFPLHFDDHLDLPILLLPASLRLNTVEVIGERSSVEQKVDRKVIHVGKDLQTGGGDALEVLNQLAEVQSNPDGGVELRGSGNVAILLNGKPSPLAPQDLLRQIDATTIRQIELITTPSAKFQADGLTGLINIITQKKNKPGFNASINGSLNSNPEHRTSLNMSRGSQHLNLNLQAVYSNTDITSRMLRNRTSETFEYRQKSRNHFDGTVKTIMAGLDWFLDKKNELSFSAHYTENDHLITTSSEMEETAKAYEFVARNRHAHHSAEYNLNYRRSFHKKEHYLEADFQLSENQNDLRAHFINPNESTQQYLDYHTRISTGALDYVLPLKAGEMTLETGFLYTLKDINNQQFLNTERNERFGFEESTLAFYSLLKKNWDKVNLQLGLRYEDFSSKSAFENSRQNFDQGFQNWFPSLHINYRLSNNIQSTLAYNRRTSRPGLWHVNPFANASNPFFNRQGNPSLQPEFSHNLEWNWGIQVKKWSVSPTLFFRHKTDLIIPLYREEESGLLWQSFDNLGKSQAYGTEWTMSYSPVSFLKTSFTGNIYWEKILSEENIELGFKLLKRHNFTLRNQFTLNKSLSLDLSWFYRGGGTYRFSRSLKSHKIDLALRWKVLKGKGSLNVRLTDVFNTFQSESVLIGEGFEEYNFRKWPSRLAYLSFNIKFASSEILKRRNRKNRRLDKSGALE